MKRLFILPAILISLFALGSVAFGENGWNIFFSDAFASKALGNLWKVIDGNWKIEDGALSGKGTIMSAMTSKPDDSPGFQKVEFELVPGASNASENNIRCFFFAADDGSPKPFLNGYSVLFTDKNKVILYRKADELTKVDFTLESGRRYKISLENLYGNITCSVDGKVIIEYKDNSAIFGKAHEHVGFCFSETAKVYGMKVFVKRLPNNLDLD